MADEPRDPRIDPQMGDVIQLLYFDFDETEVEIHVVWQPRFPDYCVGVKCPEKQPFDQPEQVARVALWAFREWVKDGTVIRRAEEAQNG